MTDTPSKLTKDQKKKYGPKPYPGRGYGPDALIKASVRHDDECGNGHNTFSITGDIYVPGRRDSRASGCIHEDIAVGFPELAPFIKWHLVSTDGPMHYLANTVYHAGDRDHNGLLKGESRQIRGSDGQLWWELEIVNDPKLQLSGTPTDAKYAGNATVPLFIVKHSVKGLCPEFVPALRWVARCIIGEGKARELDAARRSAIWPDATDEDLIAPGLEERLKARLPALLAEFRKDVESLGFVY